MNNTTQKYSRVTTTSTMICTIQSMGNENLVQYSILLTNRNTIDCIRMSTFESVCASDLQVSTQIIGVMSYSSDLNVSLGRIQFKIYLPVVETNVQIQTYSS